MRSVFQIFTRKILKLDEKSVQLKGEHWDKVCKFSIGTRGKLTEDTKDNKEKEDQRFRCMSQ